MIKTPALSLTAILICITGISLVGLQLQILGWFFLCMSAASLWFLPKSGRKDFSLIIGSLGILGLTRIDTDISIQHMVSMSLALGIAVALPYLISRFIYCDRSITFHWLNNREWSRQEYLYIALTATISYFLLPYYLKSTGAYLNWPSATDTESLILLFIGTNALGIWDELFFVNTVLGILRRHFAFFYANIFQAILFTSFLFELGFTGWGPVMIFPFALLQGYIFMKTQSLLYVITIHLTLDAVLYLALIYSHHPGLVPLFFF